jgi:hypothetical protein
MKLTGSIKMRKSDDQIMGDLHSYPVVKNIDTANIGNRQITYLITKKEEKKKKEAIIFVHGSPGSLDAFLKYMHNEDLLSKADLIRRSFDAPAFDVLETSFPGRLFIVAFFPAVLRGQPSSRLSAV